MPLRDTPFLDAVARGPLVFDGAMGTQLYERGYFITRSFDEANLARPDLVLGIHREYVAAGAQIIESNTFGANRELLSRYGAQDRLVDINRAGVRLARQAAGKIAYVAGSVGRTGRMTGTLTDERRAALETVFREQIEALLLEGVDLLVLETFISAGEMESALRAARALYPGPIVAQMSFSEDRPAIDGLSPGMIADFLGDRGADVVGVNCAEGPAFVFEVARAMLGHGRPVSAQPNAGRPRRLDERTIYMTTPEYFGVYARRLYQSGVALVGGCCGTSPEHIRRVVDAAAMLAGGRVKVVAAAGAAPAASIGRRPGTPTEKKSPLGEKIARVFGERLGRGAARGAPRGPEDFVVSVEVNPEPGLDLAKPLPEPTGFLMACGAEPAAHDYERELRRLEEKKRAGAELIMTQPVYDPEVLRRFLDDTRALELPILAGICPLASSRNAEFLHNEVPGMQIPQAIRERMAAATDPDAGRRAGVLIAREMLDQVKEDVVGAYLMPQFGQYRSAVDVLETVGYRFAEEDRQDRRR